jgi:hypothetical protein
VSAAAVVTAPAVRARQCPLCETPAGRPCQDKPSGDHLARYLDAYTAGHLTKAYIAMAVGELVVIDGCMVIASSDGAGHSLIGRLVEGACDDAPCPLVGLVVGQVDEDTLEVLWGDRRFEENPGPGTYEPFDALRPARDGAR